MNDPEKPLRDPRGQALALLGLAVAVGLFAALASGGRAPADAVAVVVEGCSGPCRESLARRVGFHLERAGFSVAPTSSPEGAAHLVRVVLAPVESAPAEGEEPARVRARVSVSASAGREVAGDVVELLASAPTVDEGLLEVGLAGVDGLVAEVLPTLLRSPAVDELLRADPTTSNVGPRDALGAARARLEAMERVQAHFRATCDSTVVELAETVPGGAAPRCLTGGCAAEHAIGVSPDQGSVFVVVHPSRGVFQLDEPADVRRLEEADRLERVPLDGGPREVLARVERLYGDATLSADGRTLAWVEQAQDRYLLRVASAAGGDARTLVTERAPARLLRPRLSPDGRSVAFTRFEHASAVPTFEWVPVAGGSPRPVVRHGTHGEWVRLPTTPGGDPELLLAAILPGDDEILETVAAVAEGRALDAGPGGAAHAPDAGADEDLLAFEDLLDGQDFEEGLPPLTHVALVRPDDGEVLARVGGLERPVGSVVGASGERLVALYQSLRFGCGLVLFDLPAGSSAFVPTPTCLYDGRLTADGRVAGTSVLSTDDDPSPDDPEVVLVGLDGTGLVALTADGRPDHRPLPLRGGDVVVDRTLPKRYARHPRAGVCVVPGRPPPDPPAPPDAGAPSGA